MTAMTYLNVPSVQKNVLLPIKTVKNKIITDQVIIYMVYILK